MPKKENRYRLDENFKLELDYIYMYSSEETKNMTGEELKNFFMHQFSPTQEKKSNIRKAVGEQAEVKEKEIKTARKQVHLQAMNEVLDYVVQRKETSKNLEKKHGFLLGRPLNSLIRMDSSEEANAYNDKIFSVNESKNAKEVCEMYYNELKYHMEKNQLRYPESFLEVYSMNDRQIVENYPKYRRVLELMFEMDKFDHDFKFKDHLDSEKYHELKSMKSMLQNIKSLFNKKTEMIMNPYYPDYDNEMISSVHSYEEINKISGKFRGDKKKGEIELNPLSMYFFNIGSLKLSTGMACAGLMGTKYNDFKDVSLYTVQGNGKKAVMDDVESYFAMSRPVFLVTKENEVKIASVDLTYKEETPREYMDRLFVKLKKADNYRFFGSNEFETMRKAFEEAKMRMTAPEKDMTADLIEDLKEKMEQLRNAADDYLKYKGIEVEGNMVASKYCNQDHLKDKTTKKDLGKNQNERARMEIAYGILEFSRGQSDCLAAIEVRKREQEREVREANKREENYDRIKQEDMERSFSFINHRLNERFSFEAEKFGQLELPENLPFTQHHTAILTLMACGRDHSDRNLNPDQVYENTVTYVTQKRGSQKDLDNISKARNEVKEAMEEAVAGNYEKLGTIVAEGLKRNINFLQNQKKMTLVYCGFAQVGKEILDMVNKNPQLKAVVDQKLNEKTVDAVKAANTISEVWKEGQEALNRKLTDASSVAKVSHMFCINMQISHKMIQLENTHYRKEGMKEEINRRIEQGTPMKEFQNLPEDTKTVELAHHSSMTKLYSNTMKERNLIRQVTGAEIKKVRNMEAQKGGIHNA